MVENADDILKEIKARKKAKKDGIELVDEKKDDVIGIPKVELKNFSNHVDLKEIALRVEAKK